MSLDDDVEEFFRTRGDPKKKDAKLEVHSRELSNDERIEIRPDMKKWSKSDAGGIEGCLQVLVAPMRSMKTKYNPILSPSAMDHLSSLNFLIFHSCLVF